MKPEIQRSEHTSIWYVIMTDGDGNSTVLAERETKRGALLASKRYVSEHPEILHGAAQFEDCHANVAGVK